MTTTAEPPFRASRYTTGAVLMHWLIALLVAAQLAGGYAMTHMIADGDAQFDLYQLHKSLGVMVLVLTIARIVWRLFNPPPPVPQSVNRLERGLSCLVHGLFYVLLLAIPLAGWVLITVSPTQIRTVLFFTDWLPFPHLPGLGWLGQTAQDGLADLAATTHAWLAYSMLALIVLHVAGALKHEFGAEPYLSRMSFFGGGDGPRNSYGHATTWLLTLIVFGGLVGSAAIARYEGRTEAPAAAREPVGVSPDQAAVLGSGAVAAPDDITLLQRAATTEASAQSPAAPDAGAGSTAAPDAGDGATAARWLVDESASALTYTVRFSGADVTGHFGAFDAAIVFSPDDLDNSSIDVTVDTASARIESSEISLQHLSGPDGFANREHGTARFTADTIRADGAGYVAEGTLAIRGHEEPETLRFTVAIDGDTAQAEGSLVLDRLDYGIGAKTDPAGEWLGPQVTVELAIVATRRSGDQGGDRPQAAEVSPASALADTASSGPAEASGTAEAAAGAPGPAPLWAVRPGDGRIGYEFRVGGERVAGEIGAFATEVRFAEDNLAGSSIYASIDLDSVSVTDGPLDLAQIRGPEGLDVAGNRLARFDAPTIERDEGGGLLAHGTLEVRGVSVPVTLPFTIEERDGALEARGSLSFDRRAFGFGPSAADGGPSVGRTIDVDVEILARRRRGGDGAR